MQIGMHIFKHSYILLYHCLGSLSEINFLKMCFHAAHHFSEKFQDSRTQCVKRPSLLGVNLRPILPLVPWCWQRVEGDCRRADRGSVCAITQRPSPLHRSSRTVAVIQTLSQASIILSVWCQATEWKKLHWIFQSFKMPIAPYALIPSKYEKTWLFLWSATISLCRSLTCAGPNKGRAFLFDYSEAH